MNKYKFSQNSKGKLSSCYKDLQTIFNTVIKHVDCTIVCGHRGEEVQNKAFKEKKSKLNWPMSKHNSYPSKAIDVAPYPIDWNDTKRFYYFAGYVMAIADNLYDNRLVHHRLRWGGDWDLDNDFSDQSFNDLVHYEII